MRTRLTGCSALAIALLNAGPALSQDAAANASDQPYSVTDIIVTAQFRSQRLQDTPIAISAMDARLLDQKGVTDITGAANLAPNVQLSANAGNFGGMAAIFIRGVGQADPHFAVEPGVGMYVDDVYFGVLTGSIFELLDIDRVEVLRGPQGTLAGKNSIGGSVKVFSKRPGPDPDGFAEVGYGSRNSVMARAGSNFTLVDGKLYGRISMGAKYSDGYLDRLDYACATGSTGATRRTDTSCKLGEQGGQNVLAARASLLWEPSDTIHNTLIADITHDRSQNPAVKTLTQSALWAGSANFITPWGSYTNYEDYVSTPKGGSSAGVPFTVADRTPLDAWGASNLLNIQLGNGLTLDSITAYRGSKATFASVVDAATAAINDQVWTLDHEQFTQELRLSGQIQTLADWTLGGFYYHASGSSGGRVNIAGGLALGGGGLNLDILFHDPVKTKSKSVFAHLVLHPVEGLNLTGALRYTDDSKEFTFNRLDPNGRPHPTLGALTNFPVTFKGDRLDYRVGADYRWSDDLMTYAQVSTGYKGGGVNPRPFFTSQAVTYDPETLTAYEIGLKSQLADRRVTLNAAAFFNKYKDFQSTLRACDSISPFPGAPCAQSTNVGDAEIKGVEAELFVEPVDGLRFDGSLGYLDFQYTRVNPATGITIAMKNVYTPEWTAAAGLQYELPVGNAGSITPRFDLSYRSRVEGDAINNALSSLPGRALIDAKLTWRSADGDWEAKLAVSNLANKFYYNSTFILPAAPYFAGVGVLGAPRTFMFSIKRNFD
jgi:iron complex outermembrane receptor protein